MMFAIAQALYLFLPAYCANMAPVFASKFMLPWGQPVSAKYFGEHKTWRGLVAGFLTAFVVLYVQRALLTGDIKVIANLSILDYENISLFMYAAALGLGALIGDMVKSFFKRRFSRKPGSPWVPFDQLDFVFGAIIFLYPLYQMDPAMMLILVLITPILHLLANIVGYRLRLKPVWY